MTWLLPSLALPPKVGRMVSRTRKLGVQVCLMTPVAIEAFGGDADASTPGVVSTKDGTTYWSLPSYVSIWKTLNSTARESWPTSNNYVGTYVESFATSYPPGVMVTAPGQATYWRSDYWGSIHRSLATIDSGMAQISWTRHNIWSGGFSMTTSSSDSSKAGVGVQMFTVGQQASGSDGSGSGQSGNSAATQATQSSSQGTEGSGNDSGKHLSSRVAYFSDQPAAQEKSSSSGVANVVAAFRTDFSVPASTSGSGSSVGSDSGTGSGICKRFGPPQCRTALIIQQVSRAPRRVGPQTW